MKVFTYGLDVKKKRQTLNILEGKVFSVSGTGETVIVMRVVAKPDAPRIDRTFWILGDSSEYEDKFTLAHIGSVYVTGRSWHVFEELPPIKLDDLPGPFAQLGKQLKQAQQANEAAAKPKTVQLACPNCLMIWGEFLPEARTAGNNWQCNKCGWRGPGKSLLPVPAEPEPRTYYDGSQWFQFGPGAKIAIKQMEAAIIHIRQLEALGYIVKLELPSGKFEAMFPGNLKPGWDAAKENDYKAAPGGDESAVGEPV